MQDKITYYYGAKPTARKKIADAIGRGAAAAKQIILYDIETAGLAFRGVGKKKFPVVLCAVQTACSAGIIYLICLAARLPDKGAADMMFTACGMVMLGYTIKAINQINGQLVRL